MACSGPSSTGIAFERTHSDHSSGYCFRFGFLGVLKVCLLAPSDANDINHSQRIQCHSILICRRSGLVVCNSHCRQLPPRPEAPSTEGMAVIVWYGVAG